MQHCTHQFTYAFPNAQVGSCTFAVKARRGQVLASSDPLASIIDCQRSRHMPCCHAPVESYVTHTHGASLQVPRATAIRYLRLCGAYPYTTHCTHAHGRLMCGWVGATLALVLNYTREPRAETVAPTSARSVTHMAYQSSYVELIHYSPQLRACGIQCMHRSAHPSRHCDHSPAP